MKMLLKISWRNIWRNPRRSLIIALIIGIGFLGMGFSWAFTDGFFKQSIGTLINSHLSHIQIHENGFKDNQVIRKNIKEPDKILNLIKNNENIKAIAPRIKSEGMINSPESSSGVMIIGIDPRYEPYVSNIRDLVTEGKFLNNGNKNTILLGKKLAEKLKVKLGDKVVLMAQDLTLEVTGEAYRIGGLYESNSPDFDKGMVFISLNNAQEFFGITGKISEFAIILKDDKKLEETKNQIKKLIGKEYETLSWKDIMPGMASSIEMSNTSIYIFFVIILVAISFSIINTLFVVIFERFKELGIMKALGTKPLTIFYLVMLESLWMTILGTVIGGFLSFVFLNYIATVGIDFSKYAKGMSMLGMGSIIYPTITMDKVIIIILTIILLSILASIYPAIVATKIKIVEALKFN